jgi:quercetin dioxygenase-like cupin family protein
MVNGKAKPVREDFCDGLGNCLPVCPAGVLSFEEKEAAEAKRAAEAPAAPRAAAGGRTGGKDMENKSIKNIEREKVLKLAEQVQTMPGQVVSKTLAQNRAVSVTLFAFDKGEEIGRHDSDGDAMATVLEGTARFTVGGASCQIGAGEALVIPAKKEHAVFAQEAFKMLLVVVFPQTDEKGEAK